MIIEVTENNVRDAAEIYAPSWRDAHKDCCKKECIEKHTVEYVTTFLLNQIKQDKDMYMLIDEIPVGIVSIKDNMIENLYVHPNSQYKGYGTKLLLFALSKCDSEAVLWVRDNNIKACNLYEKYGFKRTGDFHVLSKEKNISEVEMKKCFNEF